MKRTLLAALLLFAGLVGAGLLLWHFAYNAVDAPPPTARVAGLSARATVHWQANAVPRIEAAAPTDALRALGYVHGTDRAWTMALWRQTATGQLAEWFGDGVLPLDRHARTLGFGRLARATFRSLPNAARAQLQAYTAGINAALRAGAARRHPELVLFDLQPAPWQPWHSLAIERLLAWLATPPPADSTLATTSSAARSFFARDDQFRRWLHVHDLHRSAAWATQEPSNPPALVQRHVLGASARPLFHDVVLQMNGRTQSGTTVPGTPFWPAGRTAQQAWALLLHSPLSLAHAPVDSSALTTDHERLETRGGDETLLTIHRLPDTLPLGDPPAVPRIADLTLPDTLTAADSSAIRDSLATRRRSVWQIRWPGLQPGSDMPAWQALSRGAAPDFQLLSGNGLRIRGDTDSPVQVLGTPPIRVPLPTGVLVSHSPWARHQAASLRTMPAPLAPAAQSVRDTSTWAAARVQALLPFYALLDVPEGRLRTALTYLRNWDFRYERASIGASIFDAWMQAYRTRTDSLFAPPNRPLPVPPEDSLARIQWADSLHADSLRRASHHRATLQQAVAHLTKRFGPDVRRWRWEHVRASHRFFPVWSADSLIDRPLRDLPDTRYAPLPEPGQGHPSVPAGGLSLLDHPPLSPTAWTAWTTLAPGHPFMVRRPRLPTDAFLRRHAAPNDRPPPLALRTDTTTSTTLLQPLR